MYEIGHGSGIEAKALLRDHGNKTGAGLEIRIVELAIALVVLEVRGVGGREKRAFMMVEPPRNLRRTGVFEVDDGVLVAVEVGLIKERPRAMQQAGEDKLSVFADALAIKAGEQRGGGSSVETLVVVEDSELSINSPFTQNFPPAQLGQRPWIYLA